MEIWFAAQAIASPVERGEALSEPFEAAQRRAHASDGAARELLAQARNVVEPLDAPRCMWSIDRLRAMEAPDPSEPLEESPPQLYGLFHVIPTRAFLVANLVLEILAGLETDAAACASARILAARSRIVQLRALEERDGIEASFEGPDDPRRSQHARLVAILGELDRSWHDPDEVRVWLTAMRDEALAILEAWAPGDARLVRLREHPTVASEAGDDPFEPLRRIRALLVWAIRRIPIERMPPRAGMSDEARAVRSYMEALRSDPRSALALERAGLPHSEPRPGEDGAPATIAAACDPSAAATETAGSEEDDAELDDSESDELSMDEYAYETGMPERAYSCSGRFDADELTYFAMQEDQAERDVMSPYELALPEGSFSQFLFSAACDAGSSEACGITGWILSEGPEESRDLARAAELLERACGARFDAVTPYFDPPLACARLGVLLRRGRADTPPDYARSYDLLSRGCTAISPSSCSELIETVAAAGAAFDTDRVLGAARRACEYGAASGCALLGDLTFEGRGVPADPLAAVNEHYYRSCNSPTEWSARGCWRLGQIALHRSDLASQALLGMSNACSAGSNSAACAWTRYLSRESGEDLSEHNQRQLSELCAGGTPEACAVIADASSTAEAQVGLQSSCEAGASLGCYLLARRLRRRDAARARALYERACLDDDEVAIGCVEAAEMSARGQGGARDRERALLLRERACRLVAHPHACEGGPTPR